MFVVIVVSVFVGGVCSVVGFAAVVVAVAAVIVVLHIVNRCRDILRLVST